MALHFTGCVEKLNCYAKENLSPVVVMEEALRVKRLDDMLKWEVLSAVKVLNELDWSGEIARAFFQGSRNAFMEVK